MFRTVCVALLLLTGLPAPLAAAQVLPGGPKVTCRWGKPQGTQAIPGCGIPRRVHVTAPAGVERLMFARDDNPTLTRYLYMARAIGAPVKVFKRMINVSKTDLVLCPADFQKARILAFREMKGRAIRSRPTCELGAPGARPPRPRATPSRPTARAGGHTAGPARTPPAGMAGDRQPPSVADALERDKPVTSRDLVKLRRALKMDTFARLLAILGLILAVAALVGVALLGISLRRRLSRLERAVDRSRAPDA